MRKALKNILKMVVSRFTMEFKEILFWDRVNGKAVCLYIDKFGTEWLAQSKFGYRVKRN